MSCWRRKERKRRHVGRTCFSLPNVFFYVPISLSLSFAYPHTHTHPHTSGNGSVFERQTEEQTLVGWCALLLWECRHTGIWCQKDMYYDGFSSHFAQVKLKWRRINASSSLQVALFLLLFYFSGGPRWSLPLVPSYPQKERLWAGKRHEVSMLEEKSRVFYRKEDMRKVAVIIRMLLFWMVPVYWRERRGTQQWRKFITRVS